MGLPRPPGSPIILPATVAGIACPRSQQRVRPLVRAGGSRCARPRSALLGASGLIDKTDADFPSGLANTLRWRHGQARRMLRPDLPGAVRKPMSTAKVVRAACLTLTLALLGTACTGPRQDAGGKPVRGGTLRVLSAAPGMGLDT